MASFGSFETDRELDSGPSFTLYSARRAGAAQAEYQVKVFHVFTGDAFAEASAELDPLVADLQRASQQRIALQQQAAAASPFVARIEESGQDDRGVWYVTRLQPRSVGKIISGRVALNRNALHHLLHAAASGALAFKRNCGRSHGEILPASIQVGRGEKVEQAEVLLADPLPGDESSAAQFEAADLRAIGRILLQLVRQREITDEDDFHILPILASPEWTNLFGKDTERWLGLCNRLLDPNLSPDQFPLEQLVQELEQLRAKPAVPRGVLIGGGVLVLLVLAGGFFAMFHFKRGGLAITSDPPGAEIKLAAGGQLRSLGKTDPAAVVVKGLDKGMYKVIAELPGLPAQTNEVAVEGGKTQEHKFTFDCGRVKIVTTPERARVELGDQEVGPTPYTSPWLPAGTNTYVLRLEGYLRTKVEVVIRSDRQPSETNVTLIAQNKDERSVVFGSDPAGATIQVEGRGTNATIKAGDSLSLSYGDYKVTATLQDWPAAVSNLTVRAGTNEQNLLFRFPSGSVVFSITPEDAELVLNNKPFKLEGRQKKLQPREYALGVSRQGYHSSNVVFTVNEGARTDVNVMLRPMHGSVTLTSDPPGATIDISVAGQPGPPFATLANVTSFTTNLPPTNYTFVARHDGLKLDPVPAGPVFVRIGANIPLPFKFSYGTVRFGSEPAGATVVLGGQRFPTPHTHWQKPGPVTYRVELDYYQPEEGTREVAAGATAELVFPLRPKPVDLGLTSVPPGAEFSLSNAPLTVTGGRVSLPWGRKAITARLPAPSGLPGWEPQTRLVEIARDGSTKEAFEFAYTTLELTNTEARLYYQDREVASLPARLNLRPDLKPGDFKVGYNLEVRTNLPIQQFVAGRVFTPAIILPELRRNLTNSIGMVLGRVNGQLFMGITEVTEEEFSRVMGVPVQFGARQPKAAVPWQIAAEFCKKLTDLDADLLRKNKLDRWTYALPSEKEWADCAGADANQLFEAVFSNNPRVVFPDPNNKQALEINLLRKSTNQAGFYDLFGNVAEWCDSKCSLGGSYADSPRASQLAQAFASLLRVDSSLLKPSDPNGAILFGARNIGFRCALRPPAK